MSIIQTILSSKSTFESDRCPACGGHLLKKNGKYGQFLGCENFPDCRYAASVVQHQDVLNEKKRPKKPESLLSTAAITIEEKETKPERSDKNDQKMAAIEKLLKEDLWTPEETAMYLKFSIQKLQQMRNRGIGPPFIKFGRHVRYERIAVLEWIANAKKWGK